MADTVSGSDNPLSALKFELKELEIEKASASEVLGIFVKASSNGQTYITRVAEQSRAEKAGLKAGDYVLAVNHRRIDNKAQMAEEVHRIQKGLIMITVARRRPTPLDPQTLKPPGDAPRRSNFSYHLCRLDRMRRPHLGMVLGIVDNCVTVISVSPDGSAISFGVQARDRILAVGSETVVDQKRCEELLRLHDGKIFDVLIERSSDAECKPTGLSEEDSFQFNKAIIFVPSFQLEKVTEIASSAGVPEIPSVRKKRLRCLMKSLRNRIGKKPKIFFCKVKPPKLLDNSSSSSSSSSS